MMSSDSKDKEDSPFSTRTLRNIITCHRYIHTLQYLPSVTHQYLLMEQVTLHHHHTKNQQQEASYIQEILRHATTHPIWYQMYPPTLIQIQVHQIILPQTHQSLGILNKDDVKKSRSEKRFSDPINKCAKLTANLLKAA